jgi:hypothetical protein
MVIMGCLYCIWYVDRRCYTCHGLPRQMLAQMPLVLSAPVHGYVIAESYQIPVPNRDGLNGVMGFVSNNQIKLHPAKNFPKLPPPLPLVRVLTNALQQARNLQCLPCWF